MRDNFAWTHGPQVISHEPGRRAGSGTPLEFSFSKPIPEALGGALWVWEGEIGITGSGGTKSDGTGQINDRHKIDRHHELG